MQIQDRQLSITGAVPLTRRYGGHSMTAPLRSVLVRSPAPPAGDHDWQTFNYQHPVDQGLATAEHAALQSLLAAEGIEVVTATADPAGELDAIFAFDPSIATNRGAILCRMGKPARDDEPAMAERVYGELGIPIAGRIEAPGTLEGGDTCWLDERTLAVGRGERTNDAGIAQLTRILAALDVEVIPITLPNFRVPGDCLHLLSLISPVAADLAVAYPTLMPTSLVDLLHDRGWRLVAVPEEEFDSLGCNVLALRPGRCLMLEGNWITQSRLEAEGCEVLTYAGVEISRNRAGGPTCLTRPLWRDGADR